MNIDLLRSTLESMNLSGYGQDDNDGTLATLIRIIGVKPQPKRKSECVEYLYRFYSSAESALELYSRLSKYEKDLLTCIVQSKFRPLAEDLHLIAEKHKYKPTEKNRYSWRETYQTKYFPKGSALHAFFMNGAVPPVFVAFLENVTPPYIRVFHPCAVADEEEYAPIIGRESRYKDLDMLLKFINSQKVPATKAGGYMNKTALLQFHKIAGYDDVCNTYSGELQDIRNAGEALVSFGMVQLLRCADVIDIVKDRFVLSYKATHYACLTMPEKAKFLYEAYMQHNNDIIDECTRIFSVKLKFSRSVYDLSGPRREIASYLKECPLNEWIDCDRFSKELYKANRYLFAVAGRPMVRDDYTKQYFNEASWSSFEQSAISVVLTEYLAVLGAVDVLAEETSESEYDEYSGYEAAYFRVTDLGAYLFGITDSYSGKEAHAGNAGDAGFIVQPNFDVVIPESPDRMRHELFFDRFAERTANDKEVSVYKLDFRGMVNALNIGLYVREIDSYCEAFSSVTVPDNVKTALADWEAQSGRIRIRKATVIEAGDPLLLEEIKNYRGMGDLSEGGLTSVLVLSPNAEKKIKTLIEKNKRFCVIDIK